MVMVGRDSELPFNLFSSLSKLGLFLLCLHLIKGNKNSDSLYNAEQIAVLVL